MTIHDVSLYEPIGAVVTADTTAYTADNTTWPMADGGSPPGAIEQVYAAVNALFAEIAEPIGRPRTADQLEPTADNITTTADGAPGLGAGDTLDAEVIPVIAYAGGRPWPDVVQGFGFGILPELEGAAFGTVYTAGAAVATLSISGAAVGEADDDNELIATLMLVLDDAA